MTSCVQFENIEGQSFGTDILKGGWRTKACENRLEKKDGEIYRQSPIFSLVTKNIL